MSQTTLAVQRFPSRLIEQTFARPSIVDRKQRRHLPLRGDDLGALRLDPDRRERHLHERCDFDAIRVTLDAGLSAVAHGSWSMPEEPEEQAEDESTEED